MLCYIIRFIIVFSQASTPLSSVLLRCTTKNPPHQQRRIIFVVPAASKRFLPSNYLAHCDLFWILKKREKTTWLVD